MLLRIFMNVPISFETKPCHFICKVAREGKGREGNNTMLNPKEKKRRKEKKRMSKSLFIYYLKATPFLSFVQQTLCHFHITQIVAK
ncbi:hypothetical protein QVD17_21278 [Tagetes erecta]|uniref:Uncharacterized protein n=1 Tax=Tagetes erecta TaxID=13708 RepID=A0AAD8KMQ5_TARER|nr:hypothetical protein QVD17_21278 [Tagetes erecta]